MRIVEKIFVLFLLVSFQAFMLLDVPSLGREKAESVATISDLTSILNLTDVHYSMEYMEQISTEGSTFCLEWEVNSDEWWTHHPEWFVSHENDTHYCFTRYDENKSKFLRELYDIQFHGNCSNVTTKVMWSSGWGADFSNVLGV